MRRTRMLRWVGGGTLAAALVACGGEAPAPSGRSMSAPVQVASDAANRPPRVERVTLDPPEPRSGDDVVARVHAVDPDGDAVELQFLWTVDGRRVSERGASLRVPEHARKGLPIEVEVTAHDGRLGSEPVTAQAFVGNRPPELHGVRIEPAEGVKVGTELVAVAEGRDADDEPVSFLYHWRVNGRPVEGADGERFSTAGLKRGDQIQVRVVATDGELETPPLDSAPVVIGNSAPTITSRPGGVSADGTFRYALQASDPDGDRNLRYQLVEGPPGAQVDPLLGEVTWSATREHVGKHVFEVAVHDGHGGQARQRFEVDVKEVPREQAAALGGDDPAASID
jgi:hypothetical protein